LTIELVENAIVCQNVSAARNGRPVWPEKNWSLPKKIALRNGAGFTGSIGDGAMWVSDRAHQQKQRHRFQSERQPVRPMGEQRCEDRELDEGAVHEREADVVGADVAQHQVGDVIAGVLGGKADRRESTNDRP
jgi:hypothetical protein